MAQQRQDIRSAFDHVGAGAVNALHARFKFNDFKQAFAFMTHVAMYVEQANHHPTWTNALVEVRRYAPTYIDFLFISK